MGVNSDFLHWDKYITWYMPVNLEIRGFFPQHDNLLFYLALRISETPEADNLNPLNLT